MALTKVTSNGITDSAVNSDKIANCGVAAADLGSNAVTSAKINDGTITAADLNATLDLSSKTVTLPPSATAVVDQNIALLGFKMAVNDGLTVFNLVDGVVDEFHDESGTDEGEGSNDTYCSSNDNYANFTCGASYAAGFSPDAISEPTTSTAGTTPARNSGTSGTFTVPSNVTSVDIRVWGTGGGGSSPITCGFGGGGGYAEGTLAVTSSQVLHTVSGRGGAPAPTPGDEAYFGGGSGTGGGANGGGLAGVFAESSETTLAAPDAYVVAGSGGGGFNNGSGSKSKGGAGGGLIGWSGGQTAAFTQEGSSQTAGGGTQTAGGEAGEGLSPPSPAASGLFAGGNSFGNHSGGGGAGYYGGGGGNDNDSGGGGSSFYGHPQITSGATYAGARNGSAGQGPSNAMPVMSEGAGATGESPAISLAPNPTTGFTPEVASGSVIGEGGGDPTNSSNSGEDGFVLITGTASPVTTSTTIVSNAFTASSAPSTSRIVLFQEDVSSTTLNTDVIASISRDGGTTFTTATLTDSGYVTGSSGQRILTGTATISGQPSGTSMRWKIALANNQSKIHGVSLQWK
jgi:hypothetical protein